MARIDRFFSRVDAEQAAAFLNAHGVRALVSADDAYGNHPEIPFGIGGTVVVVDDVDAVEARTLLDREFGKDGREAFPDVVGEPDADSHQRRGLRLVGALTLATLIAAVLAEQALRWLR
jgi:hypothetical protein